MVFHNRAVASVSNDAMMLTTYSGAMERRT